MGEDSGQKNAQWERAEEAEGSRMLRVTPYQMHEVRTGLLIATLATDRLARRRPDDDEVSDTTALLHRALARILACVEVWDPPPGARRAEHTTMDSPVHGDAVGLKAEFDAVVVELARLHPPEHHLGERETLYRALNHLYGDLLAALRAAE